MTATSLVERVLALAADLRAAGVDTSIAEAIDGVEAIGHLDVGDRRLLRAGLQATLVKRSEDREVFAVLFERHFPRSPAGRVDDAASGRLVGRRPRRGAAVRRRRRPGRRSPARPSRPTPAWRHRKAASATSCTG